MVDQSDYQLRDQALTLLEKAKAQIEQEKLHDASETLQEVLSLCENAPELNDLTLTAQQLRDKVPLLSVEIIKREQMALDSVISQPLVLEAPVSAPITDTQAYIAELEELIVATLRRWRAQAEEHLQKWESVILGQAADEQLNRYKTRIAGTVSQQFQVKLFESGVRALIEGLWQEAAKLEREGRVAASFIIQNYYVKATTVAREAKGRYPESIEFVGLETAAEAMRERRAMAAQILTSAVQGEFYSRALGELQGLADDDVVPNYTFRPGDEGTIREFQDGSITVADARRKLQDLARTWAHDKALEYLDQAEGAIRDHNPQTALEYLTVERKKINPFLDSSERNSFDKLDAQAKEMLEKVNAADKQAAAALESLSTDALNAWKLAEIANGTFKWSPQVKSANETILNTLRGEVRKRKEAADKAFETRQFDTIRQINEDVKRDFGVIDDAELKWLIKQIGELQTRGDDFATKLSNAREDISRIRNVMSDNPAMAVRELADFETSYRDVVNDLPEFPQFQSDIRLSSDANAEIDRLQAIINRDSLPDVRRAVADARNAEQKYPNEQAFETIRERLELTQAYLEAEREFNLEQYEEALEKYQKVAAMPEHPKYGSAKSRVLEAERRLGDNQAIESALTDARALLDSAPKEAYMRLVNKTAANSSQRSKLQDLKNSARNKAQAQIIQRLDALRGVKQIPLTQTQTDLMDLKELGLTDEYERWNTQLEALMKAQEAQEKTQQAITSNNGTLLEEAIGLWKEAADLALKRGEATRAAEYRTNGSLALREDARLKLDIIRAELAKDGSDDEVVQARVQILQTILDQLKGMFTSDGTILLWQAQLEESLAHNSASPSRRLEFYQRAEADVNSASKLLKSGETSQQAELNRISTTSLLGQKLAAKMQEIETLFNQSTVASLTGAVKKWRDEIQQEIESKADFRRVGRWWDELRNRTVQELLNELKDGGSESVKLYPLGKLLVLDPNNPIARQAMDKLGADVDRMDTELQQQEKGALTAEGYTGSNGLEILQNQRKDMNERLRELRTLNELASSFIENKDYTLTLQAVNEKVRNRSILLQKNEATLKQFEDAIKTILNNLNAAKLTGKFDRSKTMLKQQEALRNHPAYEYINSEINFQESHRKELSDTLAEIRKLVEDEDYINAQLQMSDLDAGELATFGLDDNFSFHNPTDTRKMVQGWSTAKLFVEERTGVMSEIVEFSAALDDYHNGKGVVIWADCKRDIEKDIDSGEFEAARKTLNYALIQAPQQNMRTLPEAIEFANVPPYVQREQISAAELKEAEHNVEQRWNLAMKYAGSIKGEKMLQKLHNERLPQLQVQFEEAKVMIPKIDLDEREWADGQAQWDKGIHDIAIQFEKVGGVRKRLLWRKRQVKAALDTACAGYQKCVKVCPKHPVNTEMIGPDEQNPGLWLYSHAIQITGYDPGCSSAD